MNQDAPLNLPPVGSRVWRLAKAGERRPLFHVRAHVDDEFIVLRSWSRRRGWRYVVEHACAFDDVGGLYFRRPF